MKENIKEERLAKWMQDLLMTIEITKMRMGGFDYSGGKYGEARAEMLSMSIHGNGWAIPYELEIMNEWCKDPLTVITRIGRNVNVDLEKKD